MGMKASTMKMVLSNKIKDLLKTIDDDSIKDVINEQTIITGGAISSMLLDEPINDYDIYFKSNDAAEKVAKYYVDKFNKIKSQFKTKEYIHCAPDVRRIDKVNIRGETEERVIIFMQSAGVAGENQETYQYFEQRPEFEGDSFTESLFQREDKIELSQEILEDIKKIKYRPIFFSENAITLSDKVQLITRFTGTVGDIHDNYDFAHCMCSYDHAPRELILPRESLEALLSKALIYKGSLYPVASIFRLRKFLERGWRVTAGQLLKIMHQISNIDLNNREVLQDQLIGVDAAYMRQLIYELRKTTGKIDSTYLAKIIDKIFE